jgi:hypothetical protein
MSESPDRKAKVEPKLGTLQLVCEAVLARCAGIRGCEECLDAALVYIQAARKIAQHKIPFTLVVSEAEDACVRAEAAVLEMEDDDTEWHLAHLKRMPCSKCGAVLEAFVPDETPLLDVYPSERLCRCHSCGETLVVFTDGLRSAR